MRRNLLIVRAGDESRHPHWIHGGRARNFDLMASYYGAEPDRYRQEADHYHAMTGPRWPAHHAIWRTRSDLLERYDYVGFACDDLEADLTTWNALFDTCRRYTLDLAQPAIEGYTNHDITRPRRGCILRFTNFVEIMCPVFSRQTLQSLGGTFGESVSGWGLDMLWSSLLQADRRIAIIDKVPVRHGRPAREGTLYPLLDRIGIDARAEMQKVKDKHGVPDQALSERARLMMPPHGLLRRFFPERYT